MSKQWANDTFASLEDFDPNKNLFFPLVRFQDNEQYRARIKDGHWIGCWLGIRCSALTQV
jgi:hypothetical protein